MMVAIGAILLLFIVGLCLAYVGAMRADEPKEPPEPQRPLGRQRKDRMSPDPYDRF